MSFQEFNPDGSKIPSKNNVTSMLSPRSSSSASIPKRRLSVDSQAESLEEVQEISTPSVSPSDSTVSKETEKFVRRTSPRKRKPEISTPLSTCTSFPHTKKRMCLFEVGSREVGHKLNEMFFPGIYHNLP